MSAISLRVAAIFLAITAALIRYPANAAQPSVDAAAYSTIVGITRAACLSQTKGSRFAVGAGANAGATPKGLTNAFVNAHLNVGLNGGYESWAGAAQSDLLEAQKDTNKCVVHLLDDYWRHLYLSDANNRPIPRPRSFIRIIRANPSPPAANSTPSFSENITASSGGTAIGSGSVVTFQNAGATPENPIIQERRNTVIAVWRSWISYKASHGGVSNDQINGLELPPDDWMNAKLLSLGLDFRVQRQGMQFEFHDKRPNEP